ncbi:transcription factor PAR1 [Solanum stenotomum]|uniref:transcription factor PAR1 n=1 Tax=Solanum stenotomum TaxID=172797 RepID=UPI0020D0B8EC|nr:transcription factor PAR1 [Solanum stenotomum]
MESSCEESSAIVATFSRKDKRMTQNVSKRQKRRRESGYIVNNNNEEEEEVEEKILALQKIIPGGKTLGVDMLFEETAGYILQLQCQVKALKVLASFVEGNDKQRMKLGG